MPQLTGRQMIHYSVSQHIRVNWADNRVRCGYSFWRRIPRGGADVPDGEATPEQQINSALAEDRIPGKWVFTSLDDLDDVIRQWTDICEALRARRARIMTIKAVARPPAPDIMSRIQAAAFVRSLTALEQHLADMFTYADKHTAKLKLARDKYATAERDIEARLEGTHG
jgi:hypothetical protein